MWLLELCVTAVEQHAWNLQREKQCKYHMVWFCLLHKYICILMIKPKSENLWVDMMCIWELRWNCQSGLNSPQSISFWPWTGQNSRQLVSNRWWSRQSKQVPREVQGWVRRELQTWLHLTVLFVHCCLCEEREAGSDEQHSVLGLERKGSGDQSIFQGGRAPQLPKGEFWNL